MAKWNEIIRIERELSERARFLGGDIFRKILPGYSQSPLKPV
jgi:hypothetical protein